MGLMKSLLGGEPSFEEGVKEGRKAGIADTLDAIEGRDPTRAGRYTGPLPPELRTWIDGIRATLNEPSP